MGDPATIYCSSPDTKKKCLPLSKIQKGGGDEDYSSDLNGNDWDLK